MTLPSPRPFIERIVSFYPFYPLFPIHFPLRDVRPYGGLYTNRSGKFPLISNAAFRIYLFCYITADFGPLPKASPRVYLFPFFKSISNLTKLQVSSAKKAFYVLSPLLVCGLQTNPLSRVRTVLLFPIIIIS